jgi:hypothetical protein
VQTMFQLEAARLTRSTSPWLERWRPPRWKPPPRERRVRPAVALRLVRAARRLDDRAAWRAFAP